MITDLYILCSHIKRNYHQLHNIGVENLVLASLVATPYISRLRKSRPGRPYESFPRPPSPPTMLYRCHTVYFKVTHIPPQRPPKGFRLKTSRLRISRPNGRPRDSVWKLQGYAYPGPTAAPRDSVWKLQGYDHPGTGIYVSVKKKSLLRKLQGYAYPGQDPSCSIIFRLIVKLGLSDRLNSRAWGLGIRTQTLRFEVLNPKHPSPKKNQLYIQQRSLHTIFKV